MSKPVLLSTEKTLELIEAMLGLGAPVCLDGQGFNKVDYGTMKTLYFISKSRELTEEDMFLAVSVLRKYKNTQLVDFAEDIENTFSFYSEKFADNENVVKPKKAKKKKELPELEVLEESTDNNEVVVRWNYSRKISNILKGCDETLGRWKKVDGEWVYYLHYSCIDRFMEEMKGVLKMDALQEIAASIPEEQKKVTKPKAKVVDVTSDGIALHWAYSQKVSNILKENFSRVDGHWEKTYDEESDGYIWLYCLEHKAVDKFIEYMDELLDVEDLKNIDCEIPKVTISVNREDNIDSLWISCEGKSYDGFIAETGYENGGYWNKTKQALLLPFDGVVAFYDAIPDDLYDKTDLKFWAETFRGWDNNVELIDTTNIPSLKWKPYDFQIEDAKHLLSLKRAINGNEMGCGKTFEQVIIGESIDMPKLVICPATLRLNWQREIQMVNPKADISILYSNKPYKAGKDWTIVGYPSLTKFQKELEEEKFQVVMMDEAHYLQAISNAGKPDSKRAMVAMRIAATSEYVYPITGTPKTNRNKNLYNLLRVIRHPLTKGKNAFFEYAETFCDAKRHEYGWDINGNSNDNILNEEITPVMVRHLKRDVLPNLVKMRQSIPLRVDLKKYYGYIEDYKKEKQGSAIALSLLTKAKQSVAIQKAPDSIEFAHQFVNQNEKVVIVTCFSDVVDKVCAEFDCPKIVGGMTDKAKQKAIDDFQNGDAKVIVINIVAGGVGITLTAAHHMIINDIPWTTGELEQAEGRIWRSGQSDVSMIYYMLAEGCDMDDTLQNIITQKSITINDAIDGGFGETIDFRDMMKKTTSL